MTNIIARRVIYSTWDVSNIADPEYAQMLTELIDAIKDTAHVRESSTPYDGNWFAEDFVATYLDPAEGAVRWVHAYADANGREYADFPTREQAEADYEQHVRTLQDSIDDLFDKHGNPAHYWARTDVPGVYVGGDQTDDEN